MAKAATRAKNKYRDSNYDRMELVVPKGIKDKLKAYASDKGTTVNRLINDYIDTLDLNADSKED
jgi:hypothetical protein